MPNYGKKTILDHEHMQDLGDFLPELWNLGARSDIQNQAQNFHLD